MWRYDEIKNHDFLFLTVNCCSDCEGLRFVAARWFQVFFMHACLSVHSSLYCTRVCSLEKKKKIFKGFFVVSFVARMHLEVFLCDICQCLAPLLSLPSCFICPPSPSYLLPADKCYMFSTTACWAALWYSSCQSIECDGHFFFVLND